MQYIKVICALAFLAFTGNAFAAETDASGFGLMMMVTADGSQFGGMYLGRSWELNLTADGSSQDRSQSTGNASEDVGVTLRAGYRLDVGRNATMSFGVHYHENFFGKDGDNGTAKERRYGPYVGFQRDFPGSPVYILAYILPVSYQTNNSDNDIAGGPAIKSAQYRFFQEGGIGLGYVF